MTVPTTLRDALLTERWQRECEILPQYREPHQKPEDARTRCVVRHVPSDLFLRYSRGPRTGTFWDVYGEDFLTEALATVELAKAPAPFIAISAERRQSLLELPTIVINGDRYVEYDALRRAVDGVILIRRNTG